MKLIQIQFLEKFIQEHWGEIEFKLRLKEAERDYFKEI